MAMKDWSTTDADNDDADLSNNIRWTENQAPSTVNNSARAMMTVLKNWWDDILEGTYFISAANTSVTSNAYTLTTGQGIGSLKAGLRICFIAEAASTGAVTVNVDTLGATAVQSHGEPLASGAIANGDVVIIVHDGSVFQLVHPVRQIGVDLTLVNDGAGAANPAKLILWNDSASPAQFDVVGRIDFDGEDSAGNQQNYALIFTEIIDATSTSEDGKLYIQTTQAGSATTVASFGPGIATPNATGGDKGADTVNADEYYRNGNILVQRFISSGSAITGDSAHAFAHGFGAEPDVVQAYLQCTTADINWSIGDRIVLSWMFEGGGGADIGGMIEVDATNVTVHIGDDIQMFDKSTYEISSITLGSWDLYVKAFKFAA